MRRPGESSQKELAPRGRGSVPRVITDAAPLVALGVLFLSSDPRFTFIDEEAALLNVAAQPMRAILAAFRSSAGMQMRPPLYTLLLHFWLFVTSGTPVLLRVPAIMFFIVGVWAISRAALRVAGEQSGTSMIWLAALWPFGFHYARLASGESFLFLLVAALTWAYFRYAASPSRSTGALVCLFAVLLIWASYFAWILLAFLALEEWIRTRNNPEPAAAPRFAIAAALLVVASIPLWSHLIGAIRAAARAHLPWRAALFNVGYQLYLLMISESVAPWYWKFGVPAMLAGLATLMLIFIPIKGQARRFLICGLVIVVLFAVFGTLNPERLLLIAPWLLLPAAVAIGTTHTTLWRRSVAVSLAVVAGIGWYGVVARVYYAAPRFVEPWGNLAVEAGTTVRDGGAMIGNNPALFLYLTYALRVPEATPWRFVGILPTVVRYPQVWGPEDWEAAGQPLRPTVLWIAGMPEPDSMEKAGEFLDHNCGDRTERRLVRDPGFVWKQRFLNQPAATPWLIEFRTYSCGPNATAPAAPAQ